MLKNPFGEDFDAAARKKNPFEDGEKAIDSKTAAQKIDASARRIRNLRSQLGTEGLSLAATRDLIDEVASALEAAARAIRSLEARGEGT